jgi:hypothetical protein
LIDHFDYSKRYSSVHLTSYKQRYPQLFERLSELNWKYYIIYRACRIFYYVNFITTSFLLLFYYYGNYKTVTNLFTSFWFCNEKLSKGINLAKESLENTVGYSYHNTLSLSFNRIDTKFKRHNSTSNPESLNASINAVKSLSEIEETHL